MKPVEPILVVPLFQEILEALLALLGELSEEQWTRPTVCAGWTVKDVALHMLGVDVGILSRGRDEHRIEGPDIRTHDDLVAFINHLNASWVEAARRMSQRLLVDMLRFTGDQVAAHFASLDPHALGGPVTWAGPEPAPVWLDLAREYTERWHHQQHIRDAVGRPGLKEPRYIRPVLDAFVRALPHSLRNVEASEGSQVALVISGEGGGHWVARRESGRWQLLTGTSPSCRTEVSLPEDVAWRLWTRGLTPDEARPRVTIRGDKTLGRNVLDMVSIIA